MARQLLVRSLFAGCAPLWLALSACTSAREPEAPPDPARAARLAALHDAGPAAALTLHDVQVLGRPDRRVAQALGLVLEKNGMSDLDVAATAFAVAADASWDDVPAQFAAHVRAAGAATGRWHVYGEFLGTPRSGPEEVRFVVVDGRGDVVLVDRQTPDDPAFRRTAGRDPDPMGCALLVVDRLFALADWQKRPGAVRDGRFARLWQDLSGMPAAAELEAMAQHRAALRDAIGSARFAVLPSVVPGGHDARSAERLAAALTQRFGCRAAAAPDGARLAVRADSNEQRRLWDLARGLRGAANAQAAADYVLAVDLGVGGEGSVAWVHTAICTAAGDYVVVDWQNDQHAMLQAAAPRTVEDAERFVVDRLAALLR